MIPLHREEGENSQSPSESPWGSFACDSFQGYLHRWVGHLGCQGSDERKIKVKKYISKEIMAKVFLNFVKVINP
jgi:hypothetical protein